MKEQDFECSCPMGLGYRFHRAPCEKAGAIDDLAPAEPSGVEGSEQR